MIGLITLLQMEHVFRQLELRQKAAAPAATQAAPPAATQAAPPATPPRA